MASYHFAAFLPSISALSGYIFRTSVVDFLDLLDKLDCREVDV